MIRKKFVFFALFLLFSILWGYVEVVDVPNDDGTALELRWDKMTNITKISLIRTTAEEVKEIAITELNKTNFVDSDLNAGETYLYKLSFTDNLGQVTEESVSGIPSAQWFNTGKIALVIMTLLLSLAILFYIFSARQGKELYIRKINGLETIDESVGRATELGRPILYVPGTMDIDDMQTIAGLTILEKVAFKAAEYDTELVVPVSRSMVLSTAKEIVKEAYLKAGKPDAYKPDSVFYLTDDQFGYVAGVDGIIMRQKPAANFYLGAFYAESLILAETGFASGAIQTAGTAMPSQLPFFVAACDYTLIGEELFAASAYLSKEPNQLGSLKGQDFGKAIFIIVLTVGVVLEICGIHFLKDFLTIH